MGNHQLKISSPRYRQIRLFGEEGQEAIAATRVAVVGLGGQVVVSAHGGGCLVCLDLLDQKALDVELATDAERRQRKDIYGVDSEALDEHGPSVVSVNGVVASLAVTEFMNLVTGLRGPRLHLTYNGSIGGVFLDETRKVESCYYCDAQRGQGDEADVRRHL